MISRAHLESACCDLVTDVARVSGKVQLRVAGASMVPVLWPGDMLTVQSCDPAELPTASIVVFRQNERLIAHRLLGRTGDCLITRGDARPRCDEPVKASDVVGKVESIVRDGRAVNPQPSRWQGLAAAVLRRSEWCTWLFLRVGARLRKFGAGDAPNSSADSAGS